MKKESKTLVIATTCLLAFLLLPGYNATAQGPPTTGTAGQAINIGTGAADFLFVEGYTPWAALIINAGDPTGVDRVTATFDEDTETLTIEATDNNSTNRVTILVNKAFADEYIASSEGKLDISTSHAVNYEGLETSNASAGGGVYVFHITGFSTQTITMSKASGIPFPGVVATSFAILAAAGSMILIRKNKK